MSCNEAFNYYSGISHIVEERNFFFNNFEIKITDATLKQNQLFLSDHNEQHHNKNEKFNWSME